MAVEQRYKVSWYIHDCLGDIDVTGDCKDIEVIAEDWDSAEYEAIKKIDDIYRVISTDEIRITGIRKVY